MRITCLMENTSSRPDIAAEHGLSLLIETDKRRILFDMGQTDAFAENARKLGMDLAGVDTAILSHGHYDHGGGMARFLEINGHAPVYHSSQAFGEHYHGASKYIGLDAALRGHARLRPAEGDMELGDGLSLHTCTGWKCVHPIESAGLMVRKGNGFMPERFEHEQYLLIREAGKRVLISGCSHRGIANIAAWFQPDVLVGGFHLMKLNPAEEQDRARLEQVAEELLRSGATFYTGHCTGGEAYDFLKRRMGQRLHYLRGGESVLL